MSAEPEITHPEKVLFPDTGITKGEVAAYYRDVAPVMLPHLAGRPVTMERYPAGIGKKGFIQKNVAKGFPGWLERVEVPKREGTTQYPVLRDAAGLLWIANQNCITPHVWTSRLPDLERPDLCVIDLDPPDDDGGGAAVRAAALAVRDLANELGLETWVKTSGSKGFHVVVPLDVKATWETVWRFAHGFGAALVKRHPDALTQEFLKADRAGRILIDTGRNAYGATFAASYAVRPRAAAPVSAPCTWTEIESGAVGPQSFTLRTMAARVAEMGDLWADLLQRQQSLEAPLGRVEAQLTEDDWTEAMAARTRKPGSRKGRTTRRR